MHSTGRPSPSAIDLAQRLELRVGSIVVDPATRQFSGANGSATVRPQVMLVFLTLADARGAVVSRDELVEHAWGGRFVAEDSLNGAISDIRRALREAGAEGVRIVTIPKTGYRLEQPEWAPASQLAAEVSHGGSGGMSRRWLVAGGFAAVAAGGTAAWQWRRGTSGSNAEGLIDRGLIALRQGLPALDAHGTSAFREATAREPENARAWGLLALSLRAAADYAPPELVAKTRQEAEAAARRALALDPRQSDARTALALLAPSFGRWGEAQRRLMEILADDPDNPFAVAGLGTLLMSTGQVRKCLERLDWLEAHDPLSSNLQFRRVYTLWSAGRLADADTTADRALQSWPEHPAVWLARLWTFAFTGRASRAQAMLADRATRPEMPPPAIELLSLSLAALARPASPLASQAIRANLAAAGRGPGQATSAIMVLSALGAAGAAYDVARGFLTQSGEVIVTQRHTQQQASVTDQHHRMTMMLWIPATANLRAEPRFPALCRDIGLARYWGETGVEPDYLFTKA